MHNIHWKSIRWWLVVGLLAFMPVIGFGLILNGESVHAQDESCDAGTLSTRNWSTNFCNSIVDFSEFRQGQVKDGIPAVTNPQMESIEEAATWLQDRSPVIAVEINGEAHAYPLAILMWHEIANDEIGGVPVAVTFCPLCNSSIVFDRRVGDEVLEFGVSGFLRNSDLVMFDRQTESWWQQFTGEGLVGDYAGTLLDVIPSIVVDFKSFAERYPDGLVMSRETGYRRQYGRNPYEFYDTGGPYRQFFSDDIDDRVAATERVLAGVIGGQPIAYPFNLLAQEAVINDTVGDIPVVAFWQPGKASALNAGEIDAAVDVGTAALYSRVVDEQTLTFYLDDEGIIRDEETDSAWDIFGEAIDGELAGTQLEQLIAAPHFWFAWQAFRPDTLVFGLDTE